MKIALMVDLFKPRVIKIKKALQKRGIDVITLANKDNAYFLEENKSFYGDAILFNANDFYEIEGLIKRYEIDVCHIFCETYISQWVEYIVGELQGKIKTVLDQYDSYRDYVTEIEDDFSRREKFCLENADGVCCRNYKIRHYKKYGYKPKNELLFLDYCWGTFDNGLDNRSSGKLKIVYGGRLLAATVYSPDFFIKRYNIERAGFQFISKIIHEFGGEFTIIPVIDVNEPGYSEYRNLARRYPSTKFQKPMEFSDLIRFESQMDYGIDCLDLEHIIKKYGSYPSGVKRETTYYATNKFFDYLDAGIMPIYGRDYELFGKYLEENGGALYCKLEDMPDKLPFLEASRDRFKRQAKDARQFFSIDKQIQRLLDFYQTI